MKIKHIISFVLVIDILSSCLSTEENNFNQDLNSVVFHASSADNAKTKTVLQPNGSVLWSPKDEIDIFFGENKCTFSATNDTPAAEADFVGSFKDVVWPKAPFDYLAVYPKGQGSFDGRAAIVTLPRQQVTTEDSFANELFISIARSSDFNLYFYNVCGGIKFSVTETDIKSVTFKGNNDEPIAGTAKVVFDTNGLPTIEDVIDPIYEVTLHAADGEVLQPGNWYYIVCYPAALEKGYDMVFTKEDGTVLERKKEKPVQIKRAIWGQLADSDAGLMIDNLWSSCTNWGRTKSDVESSMSHKLFKQNEEALFYKKEPENIILSFGFKENKLCTSNIIVPKSRYELMSPYLKDDSYLGIIEDVDLYVIESQNTVIISYETEIEGEEYCVFGMTPIVSEAFPPSEAIRVSLGNIVDLGPFSATLTGEVINTEEEISCGIYYGTTPDIIDAVKLSTKASNLFSCIAEALDCSTTYYYRAWAETEDEGVVYSDILSFTTADYIFNAEAIDLGLSVKWASCNLGAINPEDNGFYYAWGEIAPKTTYYFNNYNYYLSGSSWRTMLFSKYNTDNERGVIDNKIELDKEDDAAIANSGNRWRMPTKAEIEELKSKCTWTWIKQDGKHGQRVVSNINGNSIFLPAAGYMLGESNYYEKEIAGAYWSSSLYTDGTDRAWALSFYMNASITVSHPYRTEGRSVRPVTE